MKIKSHPLCRTQDGSALLITLAALVILTIILVGFSESVRIERVSARSHLDGTQATLLAQSGIDQAVSAIRETTADPERNWISQPGRLIAGAATGGGSPDARKILQQEVPLSSGLATATTNPNFRPPDLNALTFETPASHLITESPDASGNVAALRAQWVYVRKDGTLDNSAAPSTSNTVNPLVGRYAYWTDDESGKVNYNLAWTRNDANPQSISHPTKVGLAALLDPDNLTVGEDMARAIHFYDAPAAPTAPSLDEYDSLERTTFDTPLNVRRVAFDNAVPTGFLEALTAQKFNLTHYANDPGTTFFNEDRFVLTTRKDLAGERAFLDILNDPEADPGFLDSIDLTKYNATIDTLIEYLKETNWPVAPGKSLKEKYFPGDPLADLRLAQFAINIVDYVRSAESEKPFVEPTRAVIENGTVKMKKSSGSAETFIGQTRRMLITEQAMWLSETPEASGPNAGKYKARFYVEVYLPENYGLESVNLLEPEPGKLLFCYYDETARSVAASVKYDDFKGNRTSSKGGRFFRVRTSNIVTGDPILLAGNYAVLSHVFYRDTPRSVTPNVGLKTILFIGTDANDDDLIDESSPPRIAFAPNVGSTRGDPSTYLDYPINPNVSDPGDTGIPAISSFETNDPRLEYLIADWGTLRSTNTLGSDNARLTEMVGKLSSTTSPEQDTDANGKISAASLQMPAPKGSSANPTGQVQSPGELGLIHTGAHYQTTIASVPWRTIRLQPSAAPAGSEVPDWAFMDLFAAPVKTPTNAEELYSPHGNSSAGRVNVNAQITPFPITRSAPLAAVFRDARTDSTDATKVVDAAMAEQLALNVVRHQLSTGGSGIPAGKEYGYAGVFDSPGEIVEIAGIADGGEKSEQLIRDVASLLTTRGNVFGVYSIGETLKQTPAGDLTVTATKRLHAIVERYRDPTTSEVRFRDIYYRDLTP